MPRRWLRVVILSAFGMNAIPADATPIPITNGGFEDPLTGGSTAGGATGWSLTGSGGGVWNINTSPLGAWSVLAPEGNQVGWLASPAGSGPATYTQSLGVFELNTKYTVDFWAGHPLHYGSTLGTSFTVALLAGGNLLVSISATGPEGSFSPYSISVIASASPYEGLPLDLILSSSQAQTAFDGFNVEAESAVPEPSSLLLLASGVAALARRRRSRPSGRA